MVKIATFQDSIVSQFPLETLNKENQSKWTESLGVLLEF